MNVKQVIDELSKLPSEANVYFYNMEYSCYELVEVVKTEKMFVEGDSAYESPRNDISSAVEAVLLEW